MLEQIARSATFGFGASFGRDLYRSAKKNSLVWGIIGALLLSFGCRNLFLGFGRSLPYKFFVTFLGSFILIAVGAIITSLVVAIICSSVSPDHAFAAVVSLTAVLVVALMGIIWGAKDRRQIKRRISIIEQNIDFMNRMGLKDSGLESNTIRDGEGNLLKLLEEAQDRIVFSVVGRRRLRAVIAVRDGLMVSYSGVVKV